MKPRTVCADVKLPAELAPVVARLQQREAENKRMMARLRLDIAARDMEIERLAQEVKEVDLRRVAEVGAVRHDFAGEREKNAQLREKLIKAETEKRASAREVLDGKLSASTQEAERRAMEREIARLRSELAQLREKNQTL